MPSNLRCGPSRPRGCRVPVRQRAAVAPPVFGPVHALPGIRVSDHPDGYLPPRTVPAVGGRQFPTLASRCVWSRHLVDPALDAVDVLGRCQLRIRPSPGSITPAIKTTASTLSEARSRASSRLGFACRDGSPEFDPLRLDEGSRFRGRRRRSSSRSGAAVIAAWYPPAAAILVLHLQAHPPDGEGS